MKKYRVCFYLAESAREHFSHIVKGSECHVVCTASSKADALMCVAQDHYVFRFISVERIK